MTKAKPKAKPKPKPEKPKPVRQGVKAEGTRLAGAAYTEALREFRRTIGQLHLASVRRRLGFSLRQLAQHIDLPSYSLLSAIESGRAAAPVELAKKLADALDPSLEVELLRAREPVSEEVLVFLLKNPKVLARLETQVQEDKS